MPSPLPPLPTSIVVDVENLYVALDQHLRRCLAAPSIGSGFADLLNVARTIPILRSFLTDSFEKQATYFLTLQNCCPKWMEELGGQVQRAALSHLEALGIVRDLDAQELQTVVRVTVNDSVEAWKQKIESAALGTGAIDPDKPHRRGYRQEVRAWMKHIGIQSQKQAARRLGVSIDVLKSIMSDKGRARYSQDTLEQVLKGIRQAP
jgi:hypothetical protein